MKLQKKLSLFFIIQIFIFTFSMFILATQIILPSYKNIEHQNAISKSQLIKKILTNEVAHLEYLTEDWAYWDDMYSYVDTLSTQFIDVNLNMASLNTANIPTMLIFNADGKLLHIYNTNSYNAPKNQDNFSKDLISSSVGTLAYSF